MVYIVITYVRSIFALRTAFHFLLIGRFCVLILAFRRQDTEWRVRPCGQSRDDVQMAMADPSVLVFFEALTFLTQLQKCLAVTLFLDTIIYIKQNIRY